MTYIQIRDILELIRGYHIQFREALAPLEEDGHDRMEQWLARSLRRHEQHWQVALARIGNGNSKELLNVWIQFVPDDPIREHLASIDVTIPMTIDDLADLSIRFHSALAELYESLAAAVTAPRIQELFQSLVELEKATASQQAWGVRK